MASGTRVEQSDAWRLFEVELSQEKGGLERYLQKILDRCADWFHASTASLFLQREDSDEYVLAAVGGAEPTVPAQAKIRPGAGIAGLSLETGEPLLINDPSAHPLLKGKLNRRLVSSIVVPLAAPESGNIGVLNLSRKAGQEPFTEGDLTHVRSLARQISLAVANARLFARMNSAVQESRQAGEKLEAVVRSLGVAVLVVDPSGLVSDANLQAQLLFGDEPAGRSLVDLAKTASAALGVVLESGLLAAARNETARDRVLDANLDRAWSVICTPLPSGGATFAIEEVTAHERATREMARMARLAEIGQMTAAIAHEIRNPLTGIRSAAQMVLQAPEHAQEFAEIIEEEVLKLNSLCEEFLEFARPLSLRIAPVDLDALVQNLSNRMASDFAEKGVQLRVQIDGGQPTIYGDALRLEQVLRNLMRNALQACATGDHVIVSARGDGVSVEDTGCGIEPEGIEKLFIPFFTTKAGGTGLGLSNVKKIVDAHGGQLSVSSELGKGTRFEVRLG